MLFFEKSYSYNYSIDLLGFWVHTAISAPVTFQRSDHSSCSSRSPHIPWRQQGTLDCSRTSSALQLQGAPRIHPKSGHESLVFALHIRLFLLASHCWRPSEEVSSTKNSWSILCRVSVEVSIFWRSLPMRTNDPGSWWIHNQRLYTCGEVVTHICVYMGRDFLVSRSGVSGETGRDLTMSRQEPLLKT